jgi:molecular chaperone DnaK (HSP70)
VEELAVAYNYTLGAELIDEGVGRRLIKRFEEENGVVVTEERVRRQFYGEARRVKELLTIDQKAEVRLEDVMNDRGLHFTLYRSEFNVWINEFNFSLHNLFDEVLAKARISVTDVDSIELLGGTTRVPFVQQSLMTVSGMNKLNRTMNSDEAIALGAGYIGASLSHAFQLPKIGIKPIAGVNVSVVLPNDEELAIFNESSRTTDIVSFNVNSSQLNGSAIIVCNGVRMSSFRVNAAISATEILNFSVSFHFNKFTIPALYAVALLNGTKKEAVNVIVADGSPRRLTRDEFLASSRFVTRMEQIMRDRATLQRVKNEYESYIYDIKGRLEHDPDFTRVTTEAERQNITKAIGAHEEWLGGPDEERGTLAEFERRLDDLKAVAGPAELRAAELTKRPQAFAKLNETLAMVDNVLTEIWPRTRPWLAQSYYTSMRTAYNQTKRFYDEKLAGQAALSDTDDPAVTTEQIDEKRNFLEQVLSIIEKVKEPTPTPTPSKSPSTTPEESEAPEPSPEAPPEPPDERPDRTPYDNDDL